VPDREEREAFIRDQLNDSRNGLTVKETATILVVAELTGRRIQDVKELYAQAISEISDSFSRLGAPDA